MAVTEAARGPAALVKPSGSLCPRITWPLPVPREESKASSVLLPQQLCSPSGTFWGLMLLPAQTQPIHQLSLTSHYGPTLKGPKPQHPLHSKAKNLPHFTSSLGLSKRYFLSARLENQTKMLSGQKLFSFKGQSSSGWSWVHGS